ncbi:hypothetical protein OSB04_004137 [Centaurea solstitialis]|uniref:K-box domain-containing protein n=1 Tax=Centaurea solstitialis TaxID=347529 RepID=A0AA38U8M5_9ASTR|nr:hypothetical protein OSB04_004137 [Centaurea solstitialis]
MERILERYERHSYSERQLNGDDRQSQGSWTLEHAKLKARIELLQKSQRHFIGEDLDSLTLKELQNLEQQIDMALRRLRLRKDKALQDQNNVLSKEIKEKEMELSQSQTPPVEEEQQTHHHNIPSFHLGTLNLGEMYGGAGGDGEILEETRREGQPVMPHWMLQLMNQL